MLTLDHIVVHVDSTNDIATLKSELDTLGIPFEPDWGKAAKGFKIANIWVGQQYFEIVDILSSDNLWQPQWSARYIRGDRGVYCIFLKTDEDIHLLHKTLTDEGIDVTEPERTRFKWLFGLLEKKLPWQFMLLPGIPGTPVELGIIRYDAGAEKKNKPFMVPNTETEGIVGLDTAYVSSEESKKARGYLERLQHLLARDMPVHISNKVDFEQDTTVKITARLRPNKAFSGFRVADVVVVP